MIDLELHVGSIFDLGNGRRRSVPGEGQLLAQRLPMALASCSPHCQPAALDIHFAKVLITPGSQRWAGELFSSVIIASAGQLDSKGCRWLRELCW